LTYRSVNQIIAKFVDVDLLTNYDIAGFLQIHY